MLPLDIGGGYAQLAALKSYQIVKKPQQLGHEEAAGALSSGLRAYTAMHYKFRITRGETMLILNGAASNGHIALQLANCWGAKIITTGTTTQEFNYLKQLNIGIERIVDLNSEHLVDAVVEETGGLGVDYLLETADFSVTMKKYNISSRELIKCLGVHSHWITSSYLQLDPYDSRQLFLKGASISFLFEHAWLLSPSQQGRLLHILADLMQKLTAKEIRCHIAQTFPLENITDAIAAFETNLVGATVLTVQ